MPGKGDIPATRMRPKEEVLFGFWNEGGDGEAGLDGYDVGQRNEILEAMGDAPGDGMIQTELLPDVEDDGDWS